VNVVDRYSGKALAYARRWEYSAEAIQALVIECGLSEDSIVADIGSGTGMVTRHFVDRARTVYAVEPSSGMRNIATNALRSYGSYQSVSGFADATTLPDNSVHLITVGRALHWFPAESTRAEFCRILAPGGWLAVLSVKCTDQALLDSLKPVYVEENGWQPAVDKAQRHVVPLTFYFGHDSFRKLAVPGSVQESWEDFLTRISSFAAAPEPCHSRRSNFERALRAVFDERAVNGVLTVPNATEVTFGRPTSRL
jgi:ubiquinone/menaquinone biosynthesis C-methylase UbiE